jgi:putative FmdB family regulatory protein
MPTYDYICESCGHRFENFQSMKSGSLRKCPKCGKSKLKRLIGAGSGLIFKGSVFYATDYRSEGYTKQRESEKKTAAPKDATKKEPETKAKPAKKDKPEKPNKK